MAKYDQFKVSEKLISTSKEGDVELSVIFEDGDDIAAVMSATQTRVDEHIVDVQIGDGEAPSISEAVEYLQQLNSDSVRDVCRQYWISVMNSLGQGKYAYANELRDDVNTAQNQSN